VTDARGRVTFDEKGSLIGSGGDVPPHWKGAIQVVMERRLLGGSLTSESVSMPAEVYLGRLARRASRAEFEAE
jgi:hypothetical protein